VPLGLVVPAGSRFPGIGFFVRAAGPAQQLAAPLRQAIGAADADQPIFSVGTLEDMLKQRGVGRRTLAMLVGVLASVALGLAAVGIASVMAYAVRQRTREFGVRMALGAGRRDLLALVLGRGLRLAGFGLALGFIGFPLSSRLIKSQLYGVTSDDPLWILVMAAGLLAVALCACWLPARRAAKTDPMEALRCE
jgi:ABC-type antimicrobial peptide transport system permease subunit